VNSFAGKICFPAQGLESYYSKDYKSCKALCEANVACHSFATPRDLSRCDSSIREHDCFLYKKAESGVDQLGIYDCLTTYELEDAPAAPADALLQQEGLGPHFPEPH